MQVVLAELASSGWQYDGTICKSLLQDNTLGKVEGPKWVCSDVRCSIDIQRKHGDFSLDVSCQFDGKAPCVRCRAVTKTAYKKSFSRFFSFTEDDETRDQIDAPGYLQVLDLLREEIWLEHDQIVLCHEQCKGLCPVCGKNSNQEQCRCGEVDVLHPFAGLSSLSFEQKD